MNPMTKTLDTTGVVLVGLAAVGWILIVINRSMSPGIAPLAMPPWARR